MNREPTRTNYSSPGVADMEHAGAEDVESAAGVRRAPFKHYAPNGMEFCSGRIGWASRKTPNLHQVTCGNCLRLLAKRQS